MSIPAKPWNTDIESFPAELAKPQGMIGPEERRCFYWLANTQLSGKGCIVDAGSFVGASTLCFAAGAAKAGRKSFSKRPIVHAYDYFKAVDEYVAKFIRNKFRPIEKDESYLDVFEAQTADYRGMIAAHPGNFLEQTWCGDPIEILFIDIAKTAALNSHAIGEFFPHLIPGKSVVVHQDYFHCWHPYIHIGMEYFSNEFELIDEHVEFQSRVWRLVKPLPQEKIARMKAYDFSAAERMALLDRLVEKSSDHSRPMLEVVRLWQRCIDRDHAGLKKDIGRLRDKYGFDGRREVWFKQAVAVEQYQQARLETLRKSGVPFNDPDALVDVEVFEKFVADIPMLHTWDGGKTWNAGGFGPAILKGMKQAIEAHLDVPPTLIAESGAGNSTVLFLMMNPTKLYSIAPDKDLGERIRAYCDTQGVSHAALDFRVDRSEQVLPGIADALRAENKHLDVALMDGGHGWPTVFVDFCYFNAMLRKGGLLIADDLQIYSVNEFARWLSHQKEYRLVADMKKTLVWRKETDAIYLNDFGAQPYIQRQTKLRAANANPYEIV